MPSSFGLNSSTLPVGVRVVQPDLISQYVLPYANWIILAISLFVIIYSLSVYYKGRKKSGSD